MCATAFGDNESLEIVNVPHGRRWCVPGWGDRNLLEPCMERRRRVTSEERLVQLESGTRFARRFDFLTYALLVWALIRPRPYDLVIALLVLLPLVAIVIVVRSDGRYPSATEGNNFSETLWFPVVLPGIMLMLRAMGDIHLLDRTFPALLGAIVALVPAFFVALAGRPLGMRRLFLTWLILWPYGYGTIALADREMDASASQRYQATVLAMSGYKGIYRLELGPWGPRTEDHVEVGVQYSTYARVTVGDHVCIYLRQGAIRIPWFTVSTCH